MLGALAVVTQKNPVYSVLAIIASFWVRFGGQLLGAAPHEQVGRCRVAQQHVRLDDEALRHAGHFPGLTRLYAFDGFEPAIREAVDPAWPNVTPYVVLVNVRGQVQRTLGSPNADMLRRWVMP